MISPKSGLLLAAKLILSALLLWLVLHKIDVASTLERLRSTQIRWLLPALLIGPVAVLLSAWRWRILGLGLLGFREAVSYTWIGLFFGSILPGVIGGDVAKGVSLALRDKGSRDPRLPMSIVVDKLVGLWALLLLFGGVAIPLMLTHPELLAEVRRTVWVALALAAAGIAGGAVLCHPRGSWALTRFVQLLPFAILRRGAGKIADTVGSYGGKGRAVGQCVLLSLLLHSLNACALWLAMHSLAIPASPVFAAVFYPLLSGLLALPVSISGIGVRDVFALGMFSAFGLEPTAAVAFSWLLLAMSVPNALVGGVIQLYEFFRHGKSAAV